MASNFKNYGVVSGSVTTGSVSLVTAPASTTSVIHAIYITNTSPISENVTVDLFVSASGTNTGLFHVAKNLSVPNESTVVFEKPVNLEAGDKLYFKSSQSQSLEPFASVLEIT
jgi:selenocysteine-specific translation elongation factor